ncbi:MAG: hypothetical protein LBL49_10625 [Clostridiales Family XIII bacterium]|nr:hypothetical protein [Clostridiales Family XIII bacterium]
MFRNFEIEQTNIWSSSAKPYTTRIETPYSVWRSIARGEISGEDALFQRQYKVIGDFSIMHHWDELFGGAAGIITAALLPLAWLLFKPVLYEQISIPLVAGLSLAAMLGADTRLILPLSYRNCLSASPIGP